MKKLFNVIKSFFDRYFFYDKWSCNLCRKEKFDDEFFCEECESKLPKNDHNFCDHCGRKTEQKENFCLSCKERQVYLDKARSSFCYEYPISNLIKSYKYYGKKYLVNLFSHYLYQTAIKNDFKPDYICYVPMTKKALRKRKFNHGELLAKQLGEKLSVEVLDCIEKVRETKRQANLDRKERLNNLQGSFHLSQRKIFENKKIIIVDDVLTTGATSEVLAKLIKGANAKSVYLLTIASVPNKKL